MKYSVNIEDAKQNISASIKRVNAGFTPDDIVYSDIKKVILGDHLTFRYILYTGIIAKNTNYEINPVTLQVGSALAGAYDARSVCHKAVVPMERRLLEGRLGESNEPFLNKPARYKELSLNNPVRKGKDTLTLESVMRVLQNLTESNTSDALDAATYYIFQRPSRDIASLLKGASSEIKLVKEFIRDVLSVSDEGQAAAVCVGAALSTLYQSVSPSIEVRVHPVNQAGSSSNEISDIDVSLDKMPLFSLEIKDKDYTKEDVDHAVKKAITCGLNSLIFVDGPRGECNASAVEIEAWWVEQNFNLTFIDAVSLVNLTLSMAGQNSLSAFAPICLEICKQARVKDETFRRIALCAQKLNRQVD